MVPKAHSAKPVRQSQAALRFYVEVEKHIPPGRSIRPEGERAKELVNRRGLPLSRFGIRAGAGGCGDDVECAIARLYGQSRSQPAAGKRPRDG
jgi:hypothetical protein